MLARMAKLLRLPDRSPCPPAGHDPPGRTPGQPHPNRIALLARRKGWKQKHLVEATGLSQQAVSRYWRGERPLRTDTLDLFAAALGCRPAAILAGDEDIPSVPETMIVGAAFAEAGPGPGGFDLAPPWHMREILPGLAHAGQCFAARVADNSADGFYPPGSLLVACPLEALTGPLCAGDMVLVRRRDAAGHTMEILAGMLALTPDGELLVRIRSFNAEVSRVVVLGTLPQAGRMAESAAPWREAGAGAAIGYAPEPGDRDEIIARIEQKFTAQS